MRTILFFTTLFLLVSCSDSLDTAACREVVVDQSFVIEEGSLICLPGGEQLEFVEIANELCPCDVVCISPGAIRYSLDVTLSDGREVDGQFYTVNDGRDFGIDIEGENLTYVFASLEFEFVEECSLDNGSPDISNTTFILRP